MFVLLASPQDRPADHLRAQRDTFLPPVIVMTTSKHIYEEVAPVERVICKPFHLCDLLAEVERAIPLAPQRDYLEERTGQR